ncbi:MAG TPA: CPBP family intramembrane glutamic endopeptidase [Anaerolineales bacterium]|nr:CPBP family intramembrane glutamic endopeptidase [Anaerolineales bacterium]
MTTQQFSVQDNKNNFKGNKMEKSTQTQPMPFTLSLLFFGIPMLLFLAIQRVVIPFLDASGVSPLVNFYILMLPHVLFFFGALIGYRREGHLWNRSAFSQRFRLTRLSGKGWAWAIAATIGNIGLYISVYTLGLPILEWLAKLFPDPAVLNRILGDGTSFVGFPLSGNVWLLGVYFTYYFFNVVGEELWWRGYIFPRQELAYGSRTWLFHGLFWAGFHLFTPYNALAVLPGALWVSWITQKQKNTWIFLIAHATMNGLAMIQIISGILG